MQQGEHGWVDAEWILQHRLCVHVLALLRREDAVWHRREPGIVVEPELMAGLAGAHRSAPRLRHVADEQPRPAVQRARVARQSFEIFDEARVAPVAIAG